MDNVIKQGEDSSVDYQDVATQWLSADFLDLRLRSSGYVRLFFWLESVISPVIKLSSRAKSFLPKAHTVYFSVFPQICIKTTCLVS